MNKILATAFLVLPFAAMAQKKPVPAKKPVKPTAPSVKPLKNLVDSASYAIGISVANFYKEQGIGKINSDVVAKAINDVINNKKVLLDNEAANSVMMRYMNQAQASKAQPTIIEGEKFLAANKTKAGVITTASGLQYEVITQGTGPKPTADDTVICNYKGTLIDGTEFDNSYKRGAPVKFTVGGVIRGWTEALQLMNVGSKYKLYVPYQLAYGTNEVGHIPPGSTLIFEVELLEVVGKK
jgi:FKBP-type peptidyl-prolyl cis-trans isomerase